MNPTLSKLIQTISLRSNLILSFLYKTNKWSLVFRLRSYQPMRATCPAHIDLLVLSTLTVLRKVNSKKTPSLRTSRRQWRTGCTASHILHDQALERRWKCRWYPSNRMLGGSESWSGRTADDEHVAPPDRGI
jgi:hypothetical protein